MRRENIRNLTVGGVACSVDEFTDYLTSPKANFNRFRREDGW